MQISMKAARINAGLTCKVAAEKISDILHRNVTEYMVRSYESGKVIPPIDLVLAVQTIYGIPWNNIRFPYKKEETTGADHAKGSEDER